MATLVRKSKRAGTMISPRAIQLILQHFDCIDKYVAQRLLRKRPWQEPALTTLLCDLFDRDVQREEKIEYTADQLNRDLRAADDPIHVSLCIDTHQYTPAVENLITQSDLGLILTFSNQFDPSSSWIRGWLLQAKRLKPTRANPPTYDGRSRIDSWDAAQSARIEDLRNRVGSDFIRYLLYCPRPSALDQNLRALLSHQRNSAVGHKIFDYSLGLQLRDDLLSSSPTTAAGVFVSRTDNPPSTLKEIHGLLFQGTTPLSWFIVQHFSPYWDHGRDLSSEHGNIDNPIVNGIIRGDADVLRSRAAREVLGDLPLFHTLPAHTIEIGVTVGPELPQDF